MTAAELEEQAIGWFVRRESGRWSAEEEARLQTWLEDSDRHRITYLRVQAAWSNAARMRALGAGVPAGVVPARGAWGDRTFPRGASGRVEPLVEDAGRAPSPARRSFWRPPKGIAASIGVAAIAALLAMAGSLLQGDRYITSVGGFEDIALEDGSRVLLNTDSRMRVALKSGSRQVKLTRGEAFFEIAPDPRRPFVVEAGSSRVEVVGTSFAVRRDGADIQVIVTDGKVRLDEMPLAAGSVARTANGKVIVREGSVAVAEKLLSWRTGFLNFDNLTLAEAVAEFNRYSVRKIEIADPQVGSLPLSGNFRTSNVEGFLWLLQSGFPVRIEAQERRVVLRAK